jgi:hypothetical protein
MATNIAGDSPHVRPEVMAVHLDELASYQEAAQGNQPKVGNNVRRCPKSIRIRRLGQQKLQGDAHYYAMLSLHISQQ